MPRPKPLVAWDDGLICYLPLTTPSGKVRAKRGHEPLATRSAPLAEGDLLEWQISYIEISRLLQLGYENKLIKRQELEELGKELRSQRNFFSDRYKIQRIATRQVFEGFKIIYRRHPILHKDLKHNICIEVEFKPQQKGVRAQPMVYLFIPVQELIEGEDLLGRTARLNEVVRWRPSSEILFEVVRAFALASPQYRDDMVEILEAILR
jgi:hypothetical protein